jgi:competence protein ComEC
LSLTVLDVGQGMAIVARTTRHSLIYDTGPAFGPGADSGNRIIAPYLRAVGVRRLDGLVVSHDNADHSGGAISVLQAMPVAWLASPLPDMDPLPLLIDHAFLCAAGTAWEWDGVRFEILHPALESYAARVKENDRSCVVRIVARGGAVLLAGDIEYRAEEALVAQGTEIRADVLVAPHHGSRSSSTAAFLDAVQPSRPCFPVGYRNRFGHPHPTWSSATSSVVSRSIAPTDGALSIAIDAEGASAIERYRSTYRATGSTRRRATPHARCAARYGPR